MVGPIERALIGVLLLVLMLGMGATLSMDSFRAVVRRPWAIGIGLASQFGWMPVIACLLATGLVLPAPAAIGLLLVGCCPGGSTSNMYTYFARGDVALSVAMTSVSSVAAVFAMPLLLWMYARPFTSAELQLPYAAIVQTLAITLVPIGLGMGVRRRSPRLARKLEKLGSFAGALVVLLLTVSVVWHNHASLGAMSQVEWLAASGLGALGMVLGYLAAVWARLSERARRAVCFETGVQNTALALAIIVASFEGALVADMLRVAVAYALTTTLSAGVVALVLRRSRRSTATAVATS